MKKKILTGVKPTGAPHLGNYFGAIKPFIDLVNKDDYEAIIFIADYHALNLVQDRDLLRENIIGIMIDYLACGIDPEKVLIFKQSDISAHTELCWIFDAITTMPYLMRAHAYKDAEAKDKEISVGTFNYPMLMAADILLYDTNLVPVGKDQKQHVEYARDTALKFNRIFGEAFTLPEAYILDEVAVVPGTDGQKMSKSYNNTIPLFADDEEIKKKVMSIVTDSTGDVPENVYAIHRLIKSKEELKELYDANKGKYKILKDTLISDLQDFIRPMRERRKELLENKGAVLEILDKNAEKAKAIAEAKMLEVKKLIGVTW